MTRDARSVGVGQGADGSAEMEVDTAHSSSQAHTGKAEPPRIAAGESATRMDEDDDDDWNPSVEVGVVLRPHLLRWSPTQEKGAEAEENQLSADPLHDPEADNNDQNWVAEKLMQPDEFNNRATDAVLNCPGCFTPLCYQCQKHNQFANQWRAVEVRNCTVDRSAALKPQKGDPSKYFPVRCDVCSAEVGLLDTDEVYHLFHVLASLG
mmetsp:Transcript_71451/g.170930  ORF Transcript_71451/g.170930 Transcript_71451/m.170930 type:complete len:208 (+) Transcript_71451:34-657(+)